MRTAWFDCLEDFDFDELVETLLSNTGTFTSTVKDRAFYHYKKEEVDGVTNFIYTIPLLGVKKDEVDIKCKEDNGFKNLYISVLKDTDYVDKCDSKIQLDRTADISNCVAKLADGVLTVTIKKDMSMVKEVKVVL